MFYVTKIENARMSVPVPEYHDVGSTAIAEGETVALNASGLLVKNTTAPTFIAAADAAANAKGAPVFRITPDMVFEVPVASGTPATLKAGAKITVATSGTEVVATTSESGIVTVVNPNGAAAAGDTVLVRFH